jgi:hypothetical protein
MLESKAQQLIKKSLLKQGWKKVVKFSTPSESGWPDLLAIAENQTVLWIEVKQGGQQPTALQNLRHEELREMKFPVFVARSVKDVEGLTPEFIWSRSIQKVF